METNCFDSFDCVKWETLGDTGIKINTGTRAVKTGPRESSAFFH